MTLLPVKDYNCVIYVKHCMIASARTCQFRNFLGTSLRHPAMVWCWHHEAVVLESQHCLAIPVETGVLSLDNQL